MNRRNRVIGLVAALLLMSGVAVGEAGTVDGLAGVVCFGVAAEGETVHLLIGRSGGAKGEDQRLDYTRSLDGGRSWSTPISIPTDGMAAGYLHRGNDPQIAAAGGRVMALWTAKGDGPFGSGPLAAAASDDGGATWRAVGGPVVKGAGSRAGYRFPALAGDGRGFHVVWIHAAGEERSLRWARFDAAAGRWGKPATVEPRICACCWNVLKVGEGGRLMALFRDEHPRDMKLSMSGDGGASWSDAGYVGGFGWKIDACPHVGGGLSCGPGGAVWATCWTGRDGVSGAYVGVSRDGGRSWPVMRRLGPGRATDIVAIGGEAAVAAWDQGDGDGKQAVFVSETRDGGKTWSDPRRITAEDESGAFPKLIAVGKRVLCFYSGYAGQAPPRLRLRVISE